MNEVGRKGNAPSGGGEQVKRRGLLRLGTLASAITGAFAVSAISGGRAEAAPPISEKDLAATYVEKVNSAGGVKVAGDQGLLGYQFRGANPVAGAPTTGTYSYGDVVRDVNGQNWVCITGGSPGVWNPANPGFIAQLPATFGDRYAKVNAGGPVRFSSTPFTLPVTNTINFPSAGKIIVGTGLPGGTGLPIHQTVTYTGTTTTSFTGCTIVGSDVIVPDGQEVWYGKSDLRGGTLTVANQIAAVSGADNRPHDLVLVAARDTSPGHSLGDYDIVFTREAGSFGVAQFDIPIRLGCDVSIGDSVNNRLMTIAGGNNRTADQGAPIIPAQSIVFGGTILGDQGATKSLIYKNRQRDSQFVFTKSDGTKLFYVQEAGATLPNSQLLMFASSNGSGFAYFTMTSGNTLSNTVGLGGARWMNNAFTTQIMSLTNTGSLVIGPALTTDATDGFPYIPAAAGMPTGKPTVQAGHVAVYYDTTHHKIWVYDNGWKGTVLT